MALENRVVEHPGRVVLTPVEGETNTYDMTRAEGSILREGTQLSAENLESEFRLLVAEHTADVSYETGAIGTNAGNILLCPTLRDDGYVFIGAVLISATNATAYNVTLRVSSSNGGLYADITRRSAAAVTGASIKVRASWAKLS